ncbi:hypothetical protein AeNC1_014485, partial [Aphanomyces euteiches]
MQPSDWESLSSEAYATRFWNLRYLVRVSELFRNEESVWTVLHNLITAAQKDGGTVPTPARVQAKVVECLRSATLRSSNYGTPASATTRAATINPAVSYVPSTPSNYSYLNPSPQLHAYAHLSHSTPSPAPTAASSYPPPPLPSAITHDKIPDYAHPDCFNYAGPRPVCYYCGAGGHTNLKCKVLVADYVANNMRPGFPPNIFQREGQRALDRI